MSSRENILLVQDMIEPGHKILRYSSGLTYEEFVSDDLVFDAILRNFTVIGEAAARVEIDFQELHSSIPWHQLRGYRNRLIHEYFGVDASIVWDIIQEDLGTLLKNLATIGQ